MSGGGRGQFDDAAALVASVGGPGLVTDVRCTDSGAGTRRQAGGGMRDRRG